MVRLKISNSLSTNSLSLNSLKRGSSISWSSSYYSSSGGSSSSWYSSTADEFSFNSLSTNTLKSYYDLAKINNGVNMLKLEEKQRQKVRKIMGGSDGISNSCRPIRTCHFFICGRKFPFCSIPIRYPILEYQIVAFELISNPNFYNGVMLCVFINILLLIMPTMPSNTGHNFRR